MHEWTELKLLFLSPHLHTFFNFSYSLSHSQHLSPFLSNSFTSLMDKFSARICNAAHLQNVYKYLFGESRQKIILITPRAPSSCLRGMNESGFGGKWERERESEYNLWIWSLRRKLLLSCLKNKLKIANREWN